jgi:hypothetical protein
MFILATYSFRLKKCVGHGNRYLVQNEKRFYCLSHRKDTSQCVTIEPFCNVIKRRAGIAPLAVLLLPYIHAIRKTRRVYQLCSPGCTIKIPARPLGAPWTDLFRAPARQQHQLSGPQRLGPHSELPGRSTWRCLARGRPVAHVTQSCFSSAAIPANPDPVARIAKRVGVAPATVRGPRQLSTPVIGLPLN